MATVRANVGDSVIFKGPDGAEYHLLVAVLGDYLGRRQAINLQEGLDIISVLLEAAAVQRVREMQSRVGFTPAETTVRFD